MLLTAVRNFLEEDFPDLSSETKFFATLPLHVTYYFPEIVNISQKLIKHFPQKRELYNSLRAIH